MKPQDFSNLFIKKGKRHQTEHIAPNAILD